MRNFGVEIELVGITMEQSQNAIRAAGVRVENEGYNHTDHTDHWKIVRDASVQGGHEVVSPILSSLDEVIKVATALQKAGATANKSCGLHVHMDASDLSPDAIRSICKRYAEHEEEIDAFMPASRRGAANQYCRMVWGRFSTDQFNSAVTAEDFAACQPTRYYKVNLHALVRHRTLEFRQHSGTVDAVKIANWILFIDAFIAESVRKHARLQPAHSALVDLLASRDGMTEEEIAEALGVLPATCRGAISRAKKAGAEITSERTARGTVYRASRSTRTGAGLFDGIPDSIRAFYQIRALQLA